MKLFFRFLTVGVFNTLLGYCVIFACMYLAKMSPEISNIAGYAVGLVASYILNRTYTFKSKQKRRSEIIKFLAVFLIAYAANFVTLVVFIHRIGIHEGVSQVLAGIIYVVASFIMNKYYVFKSADEDKGHRYLSSWNYRSMFKKFPTEKELQEVDCYRESRQSCWWLFSVFCGYSVFYAIFFSPVVFGGREFLSDGQLAAFYSSLTLWSDEWAGGWPAAADLTQMMFSPMRLLLRNLPYGFNLFVISSYVLSSTFMFGYVYGLTRSCLAGIVSGLVLGLSGFMVAHLGHTGIISGGAWTPLLLLALDRLRHGYKPLWLVLGSLSVCIMMLSGHPQITVYSYLVGGAYALVVGLDAKQGKWRYWLAIAGVFVVGVGLATFQWLPTYELSKETFRDAFSYEEFTSFSLPVEQALMLFFPFLYGSGYGLFFGENYFGANSYTELSGYAGVFSIILSTIAIMVRRDLLTTFWLFVALVAVVLALGGSLPWVAKLTFHVPVINQFRVPGRHIYEYDLAISVLAGLGIAALQNGQIEKEKIKMMTKVLAGFFIILIMTAVIVYSKASPQSDSQSSVYFFSARLSPAIYVPAIWMGLSIFFLFFYAKGKFGVQQGWFAVLIVMLEMASFGWFHEWRVSSVAPPLLNEAIINSYNNQAKRAQQKLISQKKLISQNGLTLPVDSGRRSGIYSLNWYGPLMLKRYSEATGLNTSGIMDTSSLSESHVGLDVFGGRYLFIESQKRIQLHGIPWDSDPLSMDMGNGCGMNLPMKHLINLPVPVAADRLAIVTQMNCSASLKDGDPVADVILHGASGQKESIVLRAGIDTAEFAAECQDVVPLMHHRRALVFESLPIVRSGVPTCNGHTYLSHPSFTLTSVVAIEVMVRDNINIRLNLPHLTLSDSHTGSTYAISPIDQSLASDRWRFLEAADGVSVYENTRAMGPAWLVFDVISVTTEQALAAIRTSVLPDGSNFDPARQALTEKNITLNGVNGTGKASVVRHDDMNWEINTQSNSSSLLVIGQNYYPGWQATVDGIPVDLFRVNYTQQGLLLPTGDHKISLEFRPVTFLLGLVISGIFLIGLIYIGWRRDHSDTVAMEVHSK